MDFIELYVFEKTNVFFFCKIVLFVLFLCLLPLIKEWAHVFSGEKQASWFNLGFI